MTIGTVVDGDPTQLTTIATWLRSSLGSGVDDAGAALGSVRQDDGGWDGAAGDNFRGRMDTAYKHAIALYDTTQSGALGIDTFSSALRTAQTDVGAARTVASTAGLTVTATAILAPAAVQPLPTTPTADATAAQVTSYNSAVTAYNTNVTRWQAYTAASTEVTRIGTALDTAATSLADVQANVLAVTVPTASILLAGVIDTYAGLGTAAITGQAAHLRTLAETLETNIKLPGAALHPELFYQDLDDAARLRAQAAGTADDAIRGVRAGRIFGAATGGILTGVSIWMDIQAGESATQATVSNVAGFAASVGVGVAIGAGVGTLIPVPIVGTVVGAVAGAVIGGAVGIFTSGMVDGFFENGPDVGAAFQQGVDDLVGTGKAIGDLASGAAGWVGDGLSDAWDSVFG
ncbi:hypothetical protein SAMN05216410_0392 [Sanguibacter gelidistatuariae]|uniref:WXG100 family type VII secretion target n=1 Tax=Sanguibacter gelidistatuariae TaxID=1814289 RepID=A0A1G6GTE3_9MICO|nr:hypothetical protein [Sanguibacter gelidistatuariae]SDB84446.1 hypothetical protein SAMN05216410_0392 [Sanguibacter gelidistatuariae]